MAEKTRADPQSTEARDARVEGLLNQMTLDEKVSLLSGKNNWQTVPIERLGIPSLTMTDGPHGVRANRTGPERVSGPATSFPTGVSMAASWDPELIAQVGIALARETRAMGCDILLGPCVNIARTPLAGRNFEAYSEDPYLAGVIGTAWVKGLQSQRVGASLKHYACNNQETERSRGNSIVDERTLREIYLAQFEMVVKEAQPWTVMCAYNRINGVYASQNDYLQNQILKEEWGFEGAVISDWGANHTTVESVAGGLDIEMPGPTRYYGGLLTQAVRTWQIEEAKVDEAVRRILHMLIRSGKLDGEELPAGAVNTEEHQSLARELAEASITLLKNDDDVLPLKDVASIAVIGPNAAEARIGGGGSSYLEPPYRVSPLEGLKAKLGDDVEVGYTQGCDNYAELPPLKPNLPPVEGQGHGLWGTFYNNTAFEGEPAAQRLDPYLDHWRLNLPAGVDEDGFAVRWEGHVKVLERGRYAFKVRNSGACRLILNGKVLIETKMDDAPDEHPVTQETAHIRLEPNYVYQLTLEYVKPEEVELRELRLLFAFDPLPEEDDRFARAVELAKRSDVAIIFGGMPQGFESEGRDRPHMRLPGAQDDLIRTVAAVNPKTIVVLNVGSPVEMPWIDDVAALVWAYYPGQEGGNAIANVLTGEVNPSGKLPITLPARYADNPTFINYPGTREVRYGEGIFVGYRYYDMKGIPPLFPFGYGLSYTTFEYSDLKVPDSVSQGESFEVSVTVTNTGDVAGAEVAQIYVADKVSSLVRPLQELKGLKKVFLEPGESKEVTFALNPRALSFYDPYAEAGTGAWVAEPGEFEILVGSSSRDIRASGSLILN
ncbi:MAG: glycoside hydrolase family 3 C-terminal domain-containing protein [Anaerolineae bacterium]